MRLGTFWRGERDVGGKDEVVEVEWGGWRGGWYKSHRSLLEIPATSRPRPCCCMNDVFSWRGLETQVRQGIISDG
jgi:hypothetical protein